MQPSVTEFIAGDESTCEKLQPGDSKYDSVFNQFTEKWDTNRAPCIDIRAIFEVHPKKALHDSFQDARDRIGDVAVFGYGQNPGNVQRRFHGTRIKCAFDGTCCSDDECSACRIIEDGFDMSKLGEWSGNKGHYGGGIYFTSMASTAKGYGLDKDAGFSFAAGNWMDTSAGSCIFVALVACGKVEEVTDKCSDEVDRSRYDSRRVDKKTGADELVIFDGAQIVLRYLIVF